MAGLEKLAAEAGALPGRLIISKLDVAEVLKNGIKPSVIVNLSSISSAGNPANPLCSSKAGLNACMRTRALELASCGVRVAGIAPGVIETPILNQISE